jgi:hypothetical protein
MLGDASVHARCTTQLRHFHGISGAHYNLDAHPSSCNPDKSVQQLQFPLHIELRPLYPCFSTSLRSYRAPEAAHDTSSRIR